MWTQENQRRINFHENFHVKDLRLYDDYRPFFRPVDYQAFPLFQELVRGLEKGKDAKSEVRQCQANNLFQFTREYVYSIELTSVLQLMPDHQMEYALFHTHLWMLMERLRLLAPQTGSLPAHLHLSDSRETLRLRAQLLRLLQTHLHTCDVKLHGRNIDYTFAHHRRLLSAIFSTACPEKRRTLLAEFVYKDVLLGRAKSTSPSLLLMTEYLFRQYEYLETVSLQTLVEGKVEWDVHRVPLHIPSSPQTRDCLSRLDQVPKESLVRVSPPSRLWSAIKHQVYCLLRKFNTL